jgi:rhodanese-related sulfurtransferase
LVYPAHGAGSACGKNLSTETVSTIGEQKRSNYALAPMSAEDFIAVVTADQPSAPAYFPHAVASNKADRDLMDLSAVSELSLQEAMARRDDGAVLVDTRDSVAFAGGHLPGSVNVGLDGRFAEYVGMVVSPDDDVVLLAPTRADADEARLRMGRIGFDRVVGVVVDIAGALAAQPESAERASRLTATALVDRQATVPDLCVVDIRNDGERKLSSIPGTVHIPMAELPRRVGELDLRRPMVVHCAGGYRSSIAASWLRAQGATDVSDLLGGITAWEALDPSITPA